MKRKSYSAKSPFVSKNIWADLKSSLLKLAIHIIAASAKGFLFKN